MKIQQPDSLLESALKYARAGLPVFPVHSVEDGRCTCGRSDCDSVGKHPWTPNGFKDATVDEEQIRFFWEKTPGANIGLATGSTAGLLVIDVDERHGGQYSLEQLKEEYDLPDTVMCQTGNGWHLYYRLPGGVVIPSRANVLPGVDVRGEGGYAIVPPSKHKDGKQYCWELSSALGEKEIALCPQMLLEMLTTRTKPKPSGGEEIVPEGCRDDFLTSQAGSMRRRNMSDKAILAALLIENENKCRPPLGEDQVRKIASSVSRYPPGKILVPHSVQQEGEWPALIPLNAVDVPTFPVDALPDYLADYVMAVSNATQTPRDLAAMITLTVLAACVAKKIEISPREGWLEPLNLYSVIALPPASRKSAVFAECTTPLLEYERELIKQEHGKIKAADNERKTLENALQLAQTTQAKALANGHTPETKVINQLTEKLLKVSVPALPRLVADDSTVESIASLLAEQHGRIAIFSAEGDLFDILAGRYSANKTINIGIVLKGHCGDFARVDRIGRESVVIDKPAITVGLAVQPDVLSGLVRQPGFRGRGLLGRFLYSLPTSNIGYRQINTSPVPENLRLQYRRRVEALLDIPIDATPRKIVLDQLAIEVFLEFEEWLEKSLAIGGELAPIPDWGGKLAGAVARIAGVLHAARSDAVTDIFSEPVSLHTLQNAIAIGKYLIVHAKAAFDLMGSNEDIEAAKFFLSWARRSGREKFTRTELFDGVKGTYKNITMLNPGLNLLIEYGYLRELPVASSGVGRKPSPLYEVNPAVNVQKSQNILYLANCTNCTDSGAEEIWQGAI